MTEPIVLQWMPATPLLVLQWEAPDGDLPPLLPDAPLPTVPVIIGGRGPAGGTTVTREAVGSVSGHRVVRSVAGGCAYASADQAEHADAVLGVTVAAAVDGAEVEIAISDEVVEPSWAWSTGPVFLGLDGALVQPAPVDVAFTLQIGFAVGPDRLLLTPRPPIFSQGAH